MRNKGYEDYTGGVNLDKLLDEEGRTIYDLPPVLAYAIETGMNSFSKQHGNANILKYTIKDGNHEKILRTIDDGQGMSKEIFKEYHKCYSGTSKLTIGDINFRGMGSKSIIKKVRRIDTETKNNGKHYRSEWHYDDTIRDTRFRLYDYVQNPNIFTPSGTCIDAIIIDKDDMNVLNEKSLIKALQKHMVGILLEEYGKREIWVNNVKIEAPYPHPRTYEKRTFDKIGEWNGDKYPPKAMFYYSPESLPEEESGIFIIVGKKTICRQDDWFRQFPKENGNHIRGYIIADYLVDVVSSGKDGFKKTKKFKEFYTVASKEWSKYLKSIGEETEKPIISEEAERIVDKVAKEIAKNLSKWDAINIALKKKRPVGTVVVPPNLPKIKCPVCGSENKKEYPEDADKWVCLECGTIFDKRWRKKGTIPRGVLHFEYEEHPIGDFRYKPSWYSIADKAIIINVTLPTWKSAEKIGGKTLDFHCKEIALTSLIEYGTDIENKTELFYTYFGDFK